ncbi:MAG: SPFH domain / Band 7 family protein [Betaproteobacteria bacterium ADurb.Bin341]|nr:MAG: SPFH domain / Band 7 family protein [Betaproteobacteria bacterium ADurb.Bin341]
MDETPPLSFLSRAKEALRQGFRHLRAQLHAYRFELVIFALVATFFLFPFVYHTIPAGHVGVLWKRFSGGTVTDEVFPEGYRLTFPWDILYIYDTRLQKMERDVDVLTSDGLQITLNLVWRYHLIPENVPTLHKFIGPDYAERMITPTVGARARDIIAIYQPDEVYTERRLKIQNQILESVRYELDDNFNPHGKKVKWLVFEDVLIKGMVLPRGVQEAIVRKNAMFHQMEEYTFRVQREHKEAERKRIEALGIRNFQEIVSNGMSESYLRWRGIEATLELAKSPNAKVVVVGNPKNGLPLILNTDSKDVAESTAKAPQPAQKKP